MAEKIVRLRISDSIYKKYKILCVKFDLSMPKQTVKLIEKFVDIHEKNHERINKTQETNFRSP